MRAREKLRPETRETLVTRETVPVVEVCLMCESQQCGEIGIAGTVLPQFVTKEWSVVITMEFTDSLLCLHLDYTTTVGLTLILKRLKAT